MVREASTRLRFVMRFKQIRTGSGPVCRATGVKEVTARCHTASTEHLRRSSARDSLSNFLLFLTTISLLTASARSVIAQPDAEQREETSVGSSPSVFSNFPRVECDAPYLDYTHAWPARWRRDPAGVQGEIVRIEGAARLRGSHTLWRSAAYRAMCVEDLSRLATAAGTRTPVGNITSNMPGIFLLDPIERTPAGSIRDDGAFERYRFVSGTPVIFEGIEFIQVQHAWFSVYEPLNEKDADLKPHGVVLFCPGLFGTPEGSVERLILSLRKRGWDVLRMHAQPSRFTEQATFKVHPDGDIAGTAEMIAGEFDSRAAECAYAVQGAFHHLETRRPELRDLPRVAVGFSGGAMTMPTVVARDPERYGVIVMVGGGSHFLLMSDKSSYSAFVNAIQVAWIGREPTLEEKTTLHNAYLSLAKFDSFHTAAALRSKRVLMIQATGDLAVPSPLGDVLWQRAGKPERWLKTGGHEALFINLTKDFGPMLDWIDSALK